MLVTCRQMREAEERVFAAGMNAAALMEHAGCGIAAVVRQFFPVPGAVILYLGCGDNAGDALVAGRELKEDGWDVSMRLSCEPTKLKDLPRRHLEAFPDPDVLAHRVSYEGCWRRPLVLLDGLLGVGSKGEMRPALREFAAEMNQLRLTGPAWTVAMDIPSGLNGDTGEATSDTVVADVTAAVGYVKAGLVADAATAHVGRLALVPIPLRGGEGDAGASALTPGLLRTWLQRRPFEMHKGEAGRVGIIAGSPGFLGAARLACEGALRAGAGFVSLLVKKDVYPLIVAALPPEVMVIVVEDYREVLAMRFDVLAIGPGLGFAAEIEVMEVLAAATIPAVVDADALTMVARGGLDLVQSMAGPRLLTPHPGEMRRLTASRPDWRAACRRPMAEMLAAELAGHVCLLKGARTVIACLGEVTLFNTTGHPGMATGGMGDVLTGVCAALVGQGFSLYRAGGLGAWLCGRAAERAALIDGEEAVLPTDVVRELGASRRELAMGCY